MVDGLTVNKYYMCMNNDVMIGLGQWVMCGAVSLAAAKVEALYLFGGGESPGIIFVGLSDEDGWIEVESENSQDGYGWVDRVDGVRHCG